MEEATDFIEVIIAILCIIGIILAFMLPITSTIRHNKDKQIELEKYKIEMEYKRGDVNNE